VAKIAHIFVFLMATLGLWYKKSRFAGHLPLAFTWATSVEESDGDLMGDGLTTRSFRRGAIAATISSSSREAESAAN
jgi:hypothetical protein